MRAVVLPAVNEPLTVQEVPSPVLKTGEAKINLSAAGWNKRDHWISKGKYPVSKRQPCLGLMGVVW